MIYPVPLSSRFGIISHVNFPLQKYACGLSLLAAAGCFSFEATKVGAGATAGLRLRATNGAPVEHVVVANNGWYLFNCWPLATGNASDGADFPWKLFQDDVDERTLHDRLTSHAALRKCDLEEMNVFEDEQVLLSIPGTSFPLPIPYVLTFREKQISAVLVRRTGGVR